VRRVIGAGLGLLLSLPVAAEPMSLDQAIELALQTDPRTEEQRYLVEAARGLLDEVKANGGWSLESNAFLAIAPRTEGSIFKNGTCVVSSNECELRDDRYKLDGLTPWYNIQARLIKPLMTFGKLENYSEAAEANIRIKQGEVELRRNATVMDVKKAYYGYLAARDSRLLLDDVNDRLQGAIDLVQGWLDEGEGKAKQSDLYALQAGQALLGKYRAQAAALEHVALDGLKVLTGVGMGQPLEVADKRIRPLPLPEQSLEALQQQALSDRAEVAQLEAGLHARRALVEANKSSTNPDLYMGVAGILSYAPGRDRLDNPFIYDPFNEIGVTPVVGVRWNWSPGVRDGKVRSAEAELNALIAKSSFARAGIPYQVAEEYHQVHGYYDSVASLEQAARSARRWMVSSYTDFEAGLEEADKVMTALQAYVLAAGDYLQTTYEYNMHVAKLEDVAGGKQ